MAERGAKRKVDEVEQGDGPLDGEGRTSKQQRVAADGASATAAAAAVADVASVGSGGGGAGAHNGVSGTHQSGDGATAAPDSAAAGDGSGTAGKAAPAEQLGEGAGGAGAGATDSAGDTGVGAAAEIAAKKEADHEAQRLERALQAAKALRESIQNGTDTMLQQEVRMYEAQKRSALAVAESYRKWRVAAVEAQLAYERGAAEQVFKNQCDTARASHLAQVNDKIRDLEEAKNGARASSGGRKLRSNAKAGSSDESSGSAPHNVFKPFFLTTDPPLQPSLKEDAVMEDLKAVHSNWLSQAKKFRRASSKDVDTPIRLERGRLMCDGDVFERGELVMVTSELTGQTFYGSITSLGSIEVGIRLADGTRSRVPISMLQQGRCKLRHQP